MSKNIRIQINSLSSSPISFNKASLHFNLQNEIVFIPIERKSIASFEQTLIKVDDKQTQQSFYIFLNNSNIVINDEIATINTFSEAKLYIEDKLNFPKEIIKHELKQVTQEINFLTASLSIGLKVDEAIRLNYLKELQFELKMKLALNLIEYEGDYNE